MTISELIRMLKKAGYKRYQHGGKHDQWINPSTNSVVEIPRHPSKEASTGLVNDILKDAGLK